MISYEEFETLKFGDKVKVSVFHVPNSEKFKYEIDYRFDSKNIPVILYCSGFNKCGDTELLIDETSRIRCWPSSKHEQLVKKHKLQIDFAGAWSVPPEAIDSICHADAIAKPKDTPPLPCVECWRFYPMAEPNCEDKKTLVCFSCRTSKGWKYETKNGVVYLRK